MRKECKEQNNVQMARVSSYHNYREGLSASNYAWSGFKSLKYYNSDRVIKLVDDEGQLKRADSKPLTAFGLEVETESSLPSDTILAEVLEKIVFSVFPADLFKLQSDSSLAGRSNAECITQLMTKSFVRNNYQNFRTMFDVYFPAFGIVAGDSCGMHCNISRALMGDSDATQTETCRKLYYLINCKYNLFCSLFRRKLSNTTFCGKQPTDKETCKRMNLSGRNSSHGVAFNLGHWDEGRIEIRLVAGQRTYASFRNTMEVIFHLLDVCKKISWKDIDDMTKLFSGCNQHVLSRLKLANEENVLSADDYNAIAAKSVTVDWQ